MDSNRLVLAQTTGRALRALAVAGKYLYSFGGSIDKIIDFEGSMYKQKIDKSSPIPCYNKEHDTQPYIEVLNDTSIVVYNTNKIFNVLELQLETENGKSEIEYILLDNPVLDINGKFEIDHNYDNLFINFKEFRYNW